MKITNNGIIMQNKVFLWIALVIGLLLLVPSAAMQFSNGVGWTLADFIVAGILLLGTGSAFVFLARKFPKYRIAIGIVITLAVIWLWVELAVGLFTNWGS